MAKDSFPRMPKWLHRWFWFWEALISGIYRVVAVVVAAGLSAFVFVALARVPWFIAVPFSLAIWIGLAIAQEHDERVTVPIDDDFLAALHTHVSPVIAPAGFSFAYASPSNRARGGPESFVYEAKGPDGDDELIWVHRDREMRTLGISTWAPFDGPGKDLRSELVDRFQTLVDPTDDAKAIARALSLWIEDRSIRFPRKTTLLKARWLNHR